MDKKVIDNPNYTNLVTRDDLARFRLFKRLAKRYGYEPTIAAPTLPDAYCAAGLLDHLHKAYGGYHWTVEVRDGIVSIWNESCSVTHGWRGEVGFFDNDGVRVKMVGGALLERYGFPARGLDIELARELPKDPRGQIKLVPGGEARFG